MRKIFVLLLLISFFCGCNQHNQVAPIVDNISFTANIDYEKQNYICEVSIVNSVLKLTVNSPRNINGLTFVVDKNVTEAKLNDISYSCNTSQLSCDNIAEIIYKILIDVTDKTIIDKEKNCIICDSLSGNNYEFVFSPSGLPLSLNVIELDLYIKFSNVVVN